MDVALRARFIDHRGRRVYLIDCEGLTPEQVLELIPKVERDVRAEPLGTVRTLIHVKDLKLESRMNADLRELAGGNAPYVKAAAVTGLSSLQHVTLNMVKLFTRRQFHIFETKEEALDFLATVE